MGLSKNDEKKIAKKIKRCKQLIENDAGTEFCEETTKIIVVCNAGLSTGLQQEVLLNETLPYGEVKRVCFPMGKSYCYLQLTSVESALATYMALNGQCPLGQDGSVLLLAFCKEFPPHTDDLWGQELPPGLILERNFVDCETEKTLLEAIACCENQQDIETNIGSSTHLKHRKVNHFGYAFLYGANNVDKSNPLQQKIPAACDVLWERLRKLYPLLNWHVPDQLTVNQYEPGQGIPPHVDTHSAFEDPILSLSLGGDIVMEFKDSSHARRCSVDLPARSLLIMSGESRYDWTHGITARKMDTIPVAPHGGLTVRKRTLRVSLTFRKLRQDDRCNCTFPKLCDTAPQSMEQQVTLLESHAAQVEAENVHRVYNEIAKHFSDTRHSPWPRVESFVQSIHPGSVLLDVGCGNGKYLSTNSSATLFGCDRSDGLLNVCRERAFNVFQCDCLAVPFRDETVDACISIAVIHHLATNERRRKAVLEMVRILRPGGRALIYVWAKNQAANNRMSSYLRQNKHNSRSIDQTTTIPAAAAEAVRIETVAGIDDCTLPVHTNRTPFQHKDLLVPWKLRSGETKQSEQKTTFLRYYHVFEEHELEQLCLEGNENVLGIVESYYDQGNWCVIFEKKGTLSR